MMGSMLVRIALIALLAALLVAGCGGGDGSEGEADGTVEEAEPAVPGDADPEEAEVIRDWADALREGDPEAAAEFFDIPSIVQNGTPPLPLTSREELIAFNRSLPCGAELTRAEEEGRYTVATFELTERPGPGECGDGVGATARTAFAIRRGLIVEWRRVPDSEPGVEPPAEEPIV